MINVTDRKRNIESLHLETGGSVIVSPIVSSVSQPSNYKIFVAVLILFVGAAIGWVLCNYFTQEAKNEAELKALSATTALTKNQEQIDNFCKENSSIGK